MITWQDFRNWFKLDGRNLRAKPNSSKWLRSGFNRFFSQKATTFYQNSTNLSKAVQTGVKKIPIWSDTIQTGHRNIAFAPNAHATSWPEWLLVHFHFPKFPLNQAVLKWVQTTALIFLLMEADKILHEPDLPLGSQIFMVETSMCATKPPARSRGELQWREHLRQESNNPRIFWNGDTRAACCFRSVSAFRLSRPDNYAIAMMSINRAGYSQFQKHTRNDNSPCVSFGKKSLSVA